MSSGPAFTFGPFTLDVTARRLTRDGELLHLTPRQFDLLHLFVRRPGEVLSSDELMHQAWSGIATTTNNLVQVIRKLRECLDPADEQRYIQTLPRDGYRFVAAVTPVERRATDEDLEALLAPHRVFLDGRAILETLELAKIAPARAAFEQAVRQHPHVAAFHIALANACVLQFEATRADARPDLDALAMAERHGREACRLDPQNGDAWATLGFVLGRMGRRDEAMAALRRGIMLQPNEWRHQLRRAIVGWGYELLAAAERTVALSRGCPQAHWLAATVFVARGALAEAEREVDLGIGEFEEAASAATPPPMVGLFWLKGMLALARGQEDEAIGWLQRELALEPAGHVYTRECCANTWYAIGAVRLRRGDRAGACAAFDEALARVPQHVKALVARAMAEGTEPPPAPSATGTAGGADGTAYGGARSVDVAIARATRLVAAGDAAGAARVVDEALASAPPGSAGWTVPVEPLLFVAADRLVWTRVLARLRNRAG